MKHEEPNIAHHIKHFLAEHLIQQRGCSLDTMHSYRDALCFLLRHLQEKHKIAPSDITAADLSAENIMGFLNDLQCSRKNSDSTRNLRLSATRPARNAESPPRATAQCGFRAVDEATQPQGAQA